MFTRTPRLPQTIESILILFTYFEGPRSDSSLESKDDDDESDVEPSEEYSLELLSLLLSLPPQNLLACSIEHPNTNC